MNNKYGSQLKKFSYFGLNEQSDIYKTKERSALLEESRGKLRENRLNSPTFKIGSQVFGNNSKINVKTIKIIFFLNFASMPGNKFFNITCNYVIKIKFQENIS